MSQLINKHCGVVYEFLKTINHNRNININEVDISCYVLNKINLTGIEERPLTDDEIRKILDHYRYFRNYFARLGMWIEL